MQGRWWQRPWHWFWPHSGDVEVATFPMHLAATARTVLADPVVGPAYQQLLDSGKRSTTPTAVTSSRPMRCAALSGVKNPAALLHDM